MNLSMQPTMRQGPITFNSFFFVKSLCYFHPHTGNGTTTTTTAPLNACVYCTCMYYIHTKQVYCVFLHVQTIVCVDVHVYLKVYTLPTCFSLNDLFFLFLKLFFCLIMAKGLDFSFSLLVVLLGARGFFLYL